ncbi:MAG: hypothetical protein MJ238_02705 [Bacilli bacterium]|nr:hypothetical protein [Bacilli bacterium]
MKKTFWYRLLVLFIAYALFAVVVLSSISGVVETWLFWLIFGIVIGGFVVLVTTEELVRYFKGKKIKNV